jgi:hypothetical protein
MRQAIYIYGRTIALFITSCLILIAGYSTSPTAADTKQAKPQTQAQIPSQPNFHDIDHWK